MSIDELQIPDSSHELKQIPLLFLWVNTGCNAKCGMCSIWRDTSGTRLSTEEIVEWIPVLKEIHVKDVQLCGEPTTHPKLPALCKGLDEAGINVHLLTNGLRLESVVDAIAAHLASVTVSLDGPSEIHDRVRAVKNAYSRLEKGMLALRSRQPHLPIEGRCVVHRHNYQALGATVDAAHDLGLSSISFLGLDVGSDAFGRDRVEEDDRRVPQDFLFDRDGVRLLKRELDRLHEAYLADFASGFIVESREALEGILVGYYTAMNGDGVYRPRETLCNAPWTSAVIDPDCRISPCFFLPAYGNLRADPLDNLINALSSRQFRANLAKKGHPVCSRCVCPRYIETGKATPFVKLR